jgi:glyoxylase-like metal-dependent hydrolase (beta-lactamase superfamily II)
VYQAQSPKLIRVSTTRIDGGTVFGATPKVHWETFARPDRQNRVAIGNYSMLIDHPDGWILVNVGPGDKAPLDLNIAPVRSRSSLLRELRDLGITPKDVTMVVLTHLHEEYAGGSTHMTSSGRIVPTFANARYVVQRDDYAAALVPSERSSRLYRRDDFTPLDEAGQLDLVDGRTELVNGIWLEPAAGPTPGHQIVTAVRHDTTYVFMGLLTPTSLHLQPSVICGADWSPESTMHSKESILARAYDEHWKVAPVGSDDWQLARDILGDHDRAPVAAPAIAELRPEREPAYARVR